MITKDKPPNMANKDEEIKDLRDTIHRIVTDMFSTEHAAGMLYDKENRSIQEGTTVSVGSMLRFSMRVRSRNGDEIKRTSFCNALAEMAAISVNDASLQLKVAASDDGSIKIQCEFSADSVGELRVVVFFKKDTHALSSAVSP